MMEELQCKIFKGDSNRVKLRLFVAITAKVKGTLLDSALNQRGYGIRVLDEEQMAFLAYNGDTVTIVATRQAIRSRK
ncbi:hypothetical protein Tco_1446033 [Tanacetum coccineum]